MAASSSDHLDGTGQDKISSIINWDDISLHDAIPIRVLLPSTRPEYSNNPNSFYNVFLLN